MVIPKIRVRIGEWDFSSTSEPQDSVELKVIEKIVHPKYNFFTYEYDLALVKLERRIDFQENIIPICLPGNEDLLVGEKHFFYIYISFLFFARLFYWLYPSVILSERDFINELIFVCKLHKYNPIK